MELAFYGALACLLICMILLVKMRGMHKEKQRIQRDHPMPVSVKEWQRRADVSLRTSRARREEE